MSDEAFPAYARIRFEDDRILYRSDYLHGEDEETPEEFSVNPEIEEAYNKFEWWRLPYELRIDMKYDLLNGAVELIAVEGVPLEKPFVLRKAGADG